MSGILVTPRDARAARMCIPGVQRFYRRHGLDFRKFVREGTPEEELLATGDSMAKQLVEVARGRQQ